MRGEWIYPSERSFFSCCVLKSSRVMLALRGRDAECSETAQTLTLLPL